MRLLILVLVILCASINAIAQEVTNNHVYTGDHLFETNDFTVYLRKNGFTKVFLVLSKQKNKHGIEHLEVTPEHTRVWHYDENHMIVIAGKCVSYTTPSELPGTCWIIGDNKEVTTYVAPFSVKERREPNFVKFTDKVQFINNKLYEIANRGSKVTDELNEAIRFFLDNNNLDMSGLVARDGYYVSIDDNLKLMRYQKIRVSDVDSYLSDLKGWSYVNDNRQSIRDQFLGFSVRNNLLMDGFVYRYKYDIETTSVYNIRVDNRFVYFSKAELLKPFHKRNTIFTFSHALMRP